MSYTGTFSSEKWTAFFVRGNIKCDVDFVNKRATVRVEYKGMVRTDIVEVYSATVEGKEEDELKLNLIMPNNGTATWKAERKDNEYKGTYECKTKEGEDNGVFILTRQMYQEPTQNGGCVVS